MFGKTLSEKLLFSTLYLIPFVPLVVSSSLLFPYISGKAFAFRFLVTIAFIFWVVVMSNNREYRPKRSLILTAIISFVSVMFIANIFGVNPSNSFFSRYERMEGFVTLGYLMALFIVLTSSFNTPQKWANFFKVSIWVSVYVATYALFQKLGYIGIRQGDVRVDATFGNAIYLAVYVMFHFFITLFYMYREKKNKWKLTFYGIVMFLQGATMYLTASRGVIIGTLIAFVLMSLAIMVFEKEDKLVRRMSMIAIASIVVLIVVFTVVKDNDFVQNEPILARFANISLKEITIESRFLIWDLTFDGFKERPLLGYGQENFNYVFNKHYVSELHRQEPWFDRAHNVILDWLIAGGILGLLAYLSLFATAGYLIFKNKEIGVVEKSILLGLIFAYGFNNIFVFDNIVSYIFFFSILGYVHTLHVKDEKVSEKDFSENSKYVIVSVLIILSVYSLFAINGKGYAQGKSLIKAMQIRVSDGRVLTSYPEGPIQNLKYYQETFAYDSFGTGEARQNLTQTTTNLLMAGVDPVAFKPFIDLTESELLKQIEEDKENALYPYLISRFYAIIGRSNESVEQILRARELSPEKQEFVILHSRIVLIKGDNEEGLRLAKEAFEMNIDNDAAWQNYITMAKDMARTDVVEDLIEQGNAHRLINYWESRIYEDPENIDMWLKTIEIKISFEDYQGAIDSIKDAKETFPEESEKFDGMLEIIRNK
ncbi:MAG: O-antigen ligase [Candidatus Paceibacteria bacterium]|jgi:O-antigen ligase